LVGELLDVLACATVELYSERESLAFWAAVAKIPDDDSAPVEQRQAATLVLAHAMSLDDDDDLAERGYRDFDAACTVIAAVDRVPETVLALVDVWVGAHAHAAALVLGALQHAEPTPT
jgi:hypothetical protein